MYFPCDGLKWKTAKWLNFILSAWPCLKPVHIEPVASVFFFLFCLAFPKGTHSQAGFWWVGSLMFRELTKVEVSMPATNQLLPWIIPQGEKCEITSHGALGYGSKSHWESMAYFALHPITYLCSLKYKINCWPLSVMPAPERWVEDFHSFWCITTCLL